MMLICCLQKIMKSSEILAIRRNIDTESTVAWLKIKLTSKRIHQTVKVRLNDRSTNKTTKDIHHGMDTISRIDHYSFVSYLNDSIDWDTIVCVETVLWNICVTGSDPPTS